MLNFFALPTLATVTRSLLALFLLALQLPAAAQAPAWQSAQAVGVATAAATDNNTRVTATAVDAAGNVFMAGTFRNTVMLGGTTLTSLGENDVFVAKFNLANNQFVWAQRAGGTYIDEANALVVAGNSVYVAGSFNSLTAGFGPAILTQTRASTGTSDVFVAKLTDAGSTSNFVWAQGAGGLESDYASALAVSGTSLYVSGAFASATASFGTANLTNTTSRNYDVFVAKLTDAGSTGSFAWAQRAGGTTSDVGRALAVRGANVYVAGSFSSPTADFSSTTLTNANTGGGLNDGFIAKLVDSGSTGNFAWAQRVGGTSADECNAMAVIGSNVYVTGAFASPTVVLGATTLTNTGSFGFDVFVAKITDTGSTGSFVWAKRAGGAGGDFAYALALNGASIYVTGIFDSSLADFGPITLTTAGAYDVFVAKLTDAGGTASFAWAQRAGGTDSDVASALALSGTGVYVTGNFSNPTASFGSTTLTNPDPNTYLGFLASLTDATLTATTATTGPREPVTLFPNPARHAATLRLPAGTAPAPLVLTDALGRAVRRYSAPAGPEAALDLNGLPAGLYLLRGAGPAPRLVVE